MGRKTSGSCIKKNRQIKNADQKDGSKRPLGIKFDSVLQTLSAAVKSRDLRLRIGVAGKIEKCERQRTFLGHLEGIGRDVWRGGGTLAFHLTCCSSCCTKSFIAISHGNERTNVNAKPVGYALMPQT